VERRLRASRSRRDPGDVVAHQLGHPTPSVTLSIYAHLFAGFLRDRVRVRGVPLRLVATRGNSQPAFGCYLPDPQAAIARAYGLLVLTLRGDHISAITWFFDRGIFPHFRLPRTLHE